LPGQHFLEGVEVVTGGGVGGDLGDERGGAGGAVSLGAGRAEQCTERSMSFPKRPAARASSSTRALASVKASTERKVCQMSA
jgi:hypothetical protein